MGTKCAPTYATLFMGKFEETYILPRITDFILFYRRFIDDIFFLWKGTETELLRIIEELSMVFAVNSDYFVQPFRYTKLPAVSRT